VSFVIRMNGTQAWPGWPSDPSVEEQVTAWTEAADAATQEAAMRRLQELAWNSVPIAPTGLFRLRTAFRRRPVRRAAGAEPLPVEPAPGVTALPPA
jgi:peptide/nickel transport system substrate-binding protein